MISQQDLERAYPFLSAWIQALLEKEAKHANPVSSTEFMRLRQYFRGDFLAHAHFVRCERVPVPPLSSMGFPQFGDFERGNWDGITFMNTFFVRHDRAHDESLFFHELIHVVQWSLLGPKNFVFLYARGLDANGYRASPLERMAYDAEERFKLDSKPWDAHAYVEKALRSPGML